MHLLVAEDDRQLRASIARGMREAGHTVDEAEDGEAAIAAAKAHPYDAIVLDILMPRVDGIEVCRTIRRAGSEVPILMLTALDAVEHRITGLDAGGDDYLVKPFDFGELLARLRALVRRRGGGGAGAPPTELVVGDLVIDSARQSARRGKREIPLTSREFAFLSYLARHAGRIVNRAELMAHVWEDSGESYSNIIDVYASRIRRKIDDPRSIPLFSTHRGSGYMLTAPEGASSSRRRR
jgi:DNA-binding response OmpR family regulator